MSKFNPEKIYIDESIKESLITKNIISSVDSSLIQFIDNPSFFFKKEIEEDYSITDSKKRLFITSHKGKVFEKCPGTKNLLCCHYYVVNFAINCHIDCSYCFLQAYNNSPFVTLFANIDSMFYEIDEMIKKKKDFIRIGTGELTDSLELDHITKFSTIIVPYFSDKENTILELKTKTDNISNLLNLKHNNKTVISWSLNPPLIIEKEEKDSASLEERLDAAYKCQEKGYKIGFHFDPIIYFDSWEKEYKEVINKIFQKISPSNIAWISLGTLRFNPDVRQVIKKRFPKSKLLVEEFIIGQDGKLRYLRPIRIKIYKTMLKIIKEYDKDIFVYLCMEGQDIWKATFGWSPSNEKNLNELFKKNSFRE